MDISVSMASLKSLTALESGRMGAWSTNSDSSLLNQRPWSAVTFLETIGNKRVESTPPKIDPKLNPINPKMTVFHGIQFRSWGRIPVRARSKNTTLWRIPMIRI
jgi:hypothetical protein